MARLGVVVAKRFLRRAVDRNLVRRLVREIFRKQHGDMPTCDVIVRLAIKPPLPLDRDVLTTEVRSLLERLRTVGRRP